MPAKKLANGLTFKQERFAMAMVECEGNQMEAYNIAYDTDNMKKDTIYRRAYELAKNGEITARIAALQAGYAKAMSFNAQKAFMEYDEAYHLAKLSNKTGDMIRATDGKCKVLGLHVDVSITKDISDPNQKLQKQADIDNYNRFLETQREDAVRIALAEKKKGAIVDVELEQGEKNAD